MHGALVTVFKPKHSPWVFSSVILEYREIFATEKNGKPNTITIVPTMMVGRTIESSEKTERKLPSGSYPESCDQKENS